MNTFIFDLDGTLLPMPSVEKFLDAYLKAISVKMLPYGFEPSKFIKALMAGTQLMINNDGSMTNEDRFWKEFELILGNGVRQYEEVFDDFYHNEFDVAKATTYTHPLAASCIQLLKNKGYQLILATNPIFPRVATYTRMLWAGLEPKDFELITTYEVSSYCKPNLEYYKEILHMTGKEPKDCIMVGNDVREDMCAASLGLDTFLLKDCLICPEGEDIKDIKQGSFEELYSMIDSLPSIM